MMKKILQLTIGAVLSCLIASLLSLQFSMAAGIITLLTFQDTKKETVVVTVKRLIIFILMTILSMVLFPITGYTIVGFGLLLIPYLACCFVLEMKEAIAPVAVLCTHYLSVKSCSFDMIKNEFLLLFIGAGIGIVINLMQSNHLKAVREKQREIDEAIRAALDRMAIYIMTTDKKEYTGTCFRELNDMLEVLKKESLRYMNNHFIGTNDYFYSYVQMRLAQCLILKRIYKDIIRLDSVPSQSKILSDCIKEISSKYQEINTGKDLLRYIHFVKKDLQNEPLPTTRHEFENRALLYHILMDLMSFVQLKKKFADGLSEEDKERYWNK